MLGTLQNISEDELIERFMNRSDEEIAELFAAHEPLRTWFLNAYWESIRCPHCKAPTHICEHGFKVHTYAPDGMGCFFSVCGMRTHAATVEEVTNATAVCHYNHQEDGRQTLSS